ncbi:hypothetical protein [Paenibacillus sp. YIM B09110]|uniref:hypothetical protein n=1 Tax=Paenibacillus sp. YIM B09110 TaxID=3126102 RepID=UPI00301C5407
MSNDPIKVPFGYEPPPETRKGTLIFYDSFEQISEQELEIAAAVARDKAFAKFVLYPLHEESVRRMSKSPVSAYYKREDRLHEWKREYGRSDVIVDRLDGKRKKYTPIDSVLRHIAETYPAPYFLYMTPETANQFASYSSFEEWIVKLRLIISSEPERLHARLAEYRHRWEIVEH